MTRRVDWSAWLLLAACVVLWWWFFGGAAHAQTTTVRTDRLIATTQAIVGGSSLGANTLNVTGTLGVSGAATVGGAFTVNGATAATSAATWQIGGALLGAIGASGYIEGDTSSHLGLIAETGRDVRIYSGGSAVERLIVRDGGNVGVGVSVPGSLLTVADTGDVSRATYTSQTTGWRITSAGAADFRYLYTDELHAKVFIADLEQALAGSQIVAKAVAIVHEDFTCPTLNTNEALVVRDLPSAAGMAVFENGDWVVLRTFARSGGSLTATECVGTVQLDTAYGTSGFLAADSTVNRPATQRYAFRRAGFESSACAGAAGSSGASPSTVPAESLALDYGTSGNGFAEVNAIDGLRAVNSPYYQTVTWTTCPTAAFRVTRMRVGNLSGVSDYTATACGGGRCWGLYAGQPDATNVTVDQTNGVRFRNGTTVLGQWTGSTITLGQPLTSDNTGQIQIDSDSVDIRWRATGGGISSVVTVSNASGAGRMYVAGNIETSGHIYASTNGVTSTSGGLLLSATGGSNDVVLYPSATGGNVRPYADQTFGLGTASYRWSELYLKENTTTSALYPLVISTGRVLAKSNGINTTTDCSANGVATVTTQYGIVTGITCR